MESNDEKNENNTGKTNRPNRYDINISKDVYRIIL